MHSAVKDISSHDGPDSAAMGKMKVLIAAGGTGGHVYPAIAIADALKKKHSNTEILFVGTKKHMEWEAVPRAGYDISNIWISGFHRRFTLKNVLFPLKLATSLIQSMMIIGKFNPDVVVSCGGYVAGPVGWVATKKGIPLIIQEQNSFPGVTNRILGKNAELIFIAFKEAKQFFPAEKTKLAGNPTRSSLAHGSRTDALKMFSLDGSKLTLLVLGGSGGAKRINESILTHIDTLHDKLNLQIIWQCGSRYYDQLHRKVNSENYQNLVLTEFIHEMPEAYAVADLVISRAGALSCSELALTGTPSVLVPSPNVAGDHQTKNAESMVETGAAELVLDKEIKVRLGELVENLIIDQKKLKKMQQAALMLARPDAANEIANDIIELMEMRELR